MDGSPHIREIKDTLAGVRKTFDCRVLALDPSAAVVLFVSTEAMTLHGLDLPAGTVTFGHFWTDRFYNVYHWMNARGETLGYYVNLSDRTSISPETLHWRDLAIDVLILPGGALRVLDEHELPADLDAETRAHVEQGRAAVLGAPAALVAEMEMRAAELRPLVFTERAP